MTIIDAIKKAISPTSEDLRSELTRAGEEERAARAAWAEDESSARWRLVEDCERARKQIEARLTAAERREAEERARAAEEARRRLIAERDELIARLAGATAFIQAKGEELVMIDAALSARHREVVAYADQRHADQRRVEDLSRQLGMPVPDEAAGVERPVLVNGIRRIVGQAQVKRNERHADSEAARQMLDGVRI